MGIVGMNRPAAMFFLVVFLRDCRIGSQVISKCQVPLDFRAFRFEAMKLKHSATGRWLIERTVSPAGNTVLAPILVAKLQNNGSLCIQLIYAPHHGQQIDNRFGMDAGDSRRTNMMNVENGTLQELEQSE